MRDIKFRAYCNQSKKMFNIISMAYFNRKKEIHKLLCYENEETSIHEPEKLFDFELMQYTGLKDRDGVEIYEGDLIQHVVRTKPDRIEYDQDKAQFVRRRGDGTYTDLVYAPLDFKVTGNIHQHPDLLEAEWAIKD